MDVEHHLRTARRRMLYFAGPVVPNKALFETHRRLFHAIKVHSTIFRYLRMAERSWIRTTGRVLYYSVDFEEKLSDFSTWAKPTSISFDSVEQARGQALLQQIGLTAGRYVCMHARDQAFGLEHHAGMWAARGVSKDQALQDESGLFNRARNSDFRDYTVAIAMLEKRGYRVVRVGASAEQPVAMPNVVDYAGRVRATLDDPAFADIYLMTNCAFYLGSSTGVTGSALAFGRPMIWLNNFPWPWRNYPPIPGSLYMPKLILKDGATLSFAEMAAMGKQYNWRALYKDQFFREQAFVVIDNDPQDIADAAEEMLDRLEGTMAYTPEDERLIALVRQSDPAGPPPETGIRMARSFLRRNHHLVENPSIRDEGNRGTDFSLRN